MAQDLIKLVAKKANISESVAQIAVETVVNALRDKIPDAIEPYIDMLLGTSAPAASKKTRSKKTTKKAAAADDPLGGLGNLIGGLGGLLGGKK